MLETIKQQMEISRQNDIIRNELEQLLFENEVSLLYVDNIKDIIEMLIKNPKLYKNEKRFEILNSASLGIIELVNKGAFSPWVTSVISSVVSDEDVLKHELVTDIVYNVCSVGCGYIYYLFKDEQISSRDDFDEIIKAVIESKNVQEAYTVARDSKILANENYVDFIKVAGKADYTDLREIRALLLNNKNIYSSKEFFEIFKLFYEQKTFLKRQIMRSAVIKYSVGQKDTSQMLNIVKIISDYKSLSKLEISDYRIFRSFESLDTEMMTKKLETFEYFKDFEEGERLFSCMELYDERTDPTIKREIESIADEISNMPKDMKLLTLSRARTMINFTKNERRFENAESENR